MCGIVAYMGAAEAHTVMLAGLARLEYRGYDSAGLAVMQESAANAGAAAEKPGGGASREGSSSAAGAVGSAARRETPHFERQRLARHSAQVRWWRGSSWGGSR